MHFLVKAACATSQQSATEKQIVTQSGLLAALVLALAPLQIFWALQIRMYSMPLTLALLSSLCLLKALEESTVKYAPWGCFTLAAAALAYTHYFGLFIIVAQFLVAFGVRAREASLAWIDRFMPVVVSALVISIMWQWWLPRFLHQRAHVVSNFYLPELSWSVWGRAFDELWVGHALPLSAWRGLCLTQVAVIFALFILLGRKRGDLLLSLGAALPLLAACIISVISQPLITTRYMQFSQVFLIPVVVILISRLPGIARLITSLGVVALVLTLGAYQWQDRAAMAQLPGLETAIETFTESASEGTPLIASNPMLFCSATVYSDQTENLTCYGEPAAYPFYQGTPVMQDDEYVDAEKLAYSHHLEVWALDAESASMGSVPLEASWVLMEEHSFQEWYTTILLRRYKRKHQQMRVIRQ